MQTNFLGDGVHGNLEAIVRVAPPSAREPDRLDFWYLDASTFRWQGPFPLIADGQPVTGVTGEPVFIQSTFGNRGNFELFVPQGNVIRHYYRDNDDPNLAWHLAGDNFGYYCPKFSACATPVSLTLIQSNFLGDGVHGNFEAVVRVFGPGATQPDRLDFWYLDVSSWKWHGPYPLSADGVPLSGVTGDPVMIQGTWDNRGNYELLVPQENMIRHYYRDNDSSSPAWHFRGEGFGYVCPPQMLCPTPRSLTFIQGNFLVDGAHGNLEAIVRVSPVGGQPDYLDAWYFDSRTKRWAPAGTIVADGKTIEVSGGF